jgi:hypothetical protein
MSPAGFKPAIPATKEPKTYDLDHAATGIGSSRLVAYANHQITGVIKK